MIRNSTLIFSLLITLIGRPQSTGGRTVFLPPLDLPLALAGNFMELRTDHFHSGIDIRTDNKEGLPVKAAGDGWVSRIKVSPWGYGKALYIDHPNGYTTVYGHLRNYTGAIADAVLAAQYKAHSFEVDVAFGKGELPLKAGDIVANSGNTGASSAPHLHFEVRRTSDQRAFDPELFGMEIPDSVPPTLLGVRLDPLEDGARVPPFPTRADGFAVGGSGGTFTLKGGTSLPAFGTIGLSVNVIDHYNRNGSTCGIRSINVRVDSVPVFSAKLDMIDFSLQRYADAYMDYALFKDEDKYYNRCYKLPNNKLGVYGDERAQGRITMVPGKDKAVHVEVLDAHGNRSVLDFALHGATAAEAAKWPHDKDAVGQLFRYDRENILAQEGLRFVLPPASLFADERITWSSDPGPLRAGKTTLPTFSPIHHVHHPQTPLYTAGELSLRASGSFPKDRTDKLLIVRSNGNSAPSAIGGMYANGWITAKVKSFGDYTIVLDTVPPKIIPVGLKADMTGKDTLEFRVGDDLSGISEYVGTLDGEWILFEYGPKKGTLTHRFDTHSSTSGKHVLKLVVRDERGNTSTFSQEFTH